MQLPCPGWHRIGGVLVTVALATAPLWPTVAYAADTVDKSETVHVQIDATGTIREIRVDDFLANDAKAQQLHDHSTLQDIKSDDEAQTYTQDNDQLLWETGGTSVSYKGTSTGQPPVDVKLSYTLDGAPCSPEELAGASGHLVMRFDYHNSVSQTRKIDGKDRTVFTPFVCLTAVILDGDIFSNVQVTNGKVVDDKGGLAVIGYATPGLKESLPENDETRDLDFPEYVQIEADVTNLELDPTYTIVTPELFSELDLSDLDLGDMDEGTDELRDAMDAVVGGSDTLANALKQLSAGTTQLGGGAAALRDALGLLPGGMTQLVSGADTLGTRLGEAAQVAGNVAQGAQGVLGEAQDAEGLAEGTQDDIAVAREAVEELKGAAQNLKLDTTRTTITGAGETAKKAQDAATGAKELIDQERTDAQTKAETATQDIEAAQDKLAAVTEDESLQLTDEQQEALAAKLADVSNTLDAARTELAPEEPQDPDPLAEKSTQLAQAAQQLADAAKQIDASAKDVSTVTGAADVALEKLDEAAGSVSDLRQQLSRVGSGANGLYAGATALSGGLAAAQAGATTLREGIAALAAQAPQAVEGAAAIATGIDALATGTEATAQGADQLTSGLSTFNDEGIAKIADALDDLGSEVTELTDTLDALRDSANAYDTFSGKAEGQSGQVRFIYKTEQIG
ncbi:MAG: hypothetical protein IKG11_09460 [Atopobiaceae bacterium]|nr:hypothetical protein [Atopobiaceae bacterium]